MGEEQKNLVYLSDKIGSEYQSWNKDALVIIKAPTGCGKSHFILNELLNYAMQQGRRILYLVNRTILKDQLIKKCNEQVAELCIRYGQIIKIWDYIRICTYQEIEQKLKCGNADPLNANIQDEKGNPIESYYYVVYDECHYFYADADFNPGTEISYVYLTQSFRHVVQIFMLLDDASTDNVTMALSENKVRISFEDITLTSKLIDGTFPDYERVIPTDNDKILEVNVKELAAAVDRVSVVTERSRGIRMITDTNHVTIAASNAELGNATEELEAKYDKESIDTGYNFRYLLDILAQIKGEEVRFSLSGSAAATVINDTSDNSAIYVLMPMRI